jgi:hypothetical protein
MKQLLSFFLLLTGGCNSAQNNPNKIPATAEPFMITYRQIGVRVPQTFFEYVFTDKKIQISANSTFIDSSNTFRSKSIIVFTKELPSSDELNTISHISISDFEQAKKDIGPVCTGGIINHIQLDKDTMTSKLVYQCAKSFDAYTKQIVKFINKEVPGKYEIHL